MVEKIIDKLREESELTSATNFGVGVLKGQIPNRQGYAAPQRHWRSALEKARAEYEAKHFVEE